MTTRGITVQRIDHIEVNVPDRYEAVAWYEQTLGLELLTDPVFIWAAQLPNGPVFVGNPTRSVLVSLFEGEPLGDREPIGQLQTCFNVDAKTFLQFMDLLPELDLRDRFGNSVSQALISDHRTGWAFYFTDPWGNRYELNTWEYAVVAEELAHRAQLKDRTDATPAPL